jgi:sugar phosphate isomerase/epimerase
MPATNRRHFLKTASGLATGALLPSFSRGIEPIQRPGKHVLKLSLAAYSMRKYLTAKPGTEGAMDLAGFVDFCASLGVEGTELTSYYFPKEVTLDYLNSIKRRAFLAGLDISGGAIRNDYCQPPGPGLDKDLAHTKTWIDHYAELGAGAIRVFAGNVPKGSDEATAVKNCISALERACELAGKRGIFLALENHGGITTHADTMLEIVRGVQSPWLGVNFDSGNFRDGPDPYAELAKIAPYAVNAQIKLSLGRKRKLEAADLSRIVGVLKDAGYSGWVALEYEEDEDPYKAIPKAIEELKRLLRA